MSEIPETLCLFPSLENSFWFSGHTFSILADGTQTANAFSLILCNLRKGGELPAYFHQTNSETYYILNGKIDFHIGERKITAVTGNMVYRPKELPFYLSLVSETAKALLLIMPPGFEKFFKEFGAPAQSLDLPPATDGGFSAAVSLRMLERSKELGAVWVPEF